MKILITGASGLLGINLAQETMHAHEITGVDRGKLVHAPFPLLKADLLAPGAVDSVIETARPDWVINCAALANLEECEDNPDLARRLNTDMPAEINRADSIAR